MAYSSEKETGSGAEWLIHAEAVEIGMEKWDLQTLVFNGVTSYFRGLFVYEVTLLYCMFALKQIL